LDGLGTALQPMNLMFALVGVMLGTAVGVMPGIGPALTVALLLPVSLSFGATGSMIMFAGIYYGGMYGGAISSILLNTPGETASIMTALEGNRMAKRGAAARRWARPPSGRSSAAPSPRWASRWSRPSW
jgi:putative tricarboxylic transport membrane protein